MVGRLEEPVGIEARESNVNTSRLFRIGALSITLAMCACASRSGPRDPFAGRGSPARQGVHNYRVRLDVACDRCLISYSIGPENERLQASRAGWRRSFRRRPLIPEAIRLTASPSPGGLAARFVRILVDGEVVAVADCECDPAAQASAGFQRTLSVETVISPA